MKPSDEIDPHGNAARPVEPGFATGRRRKPPATPSKPDETGAEAYVTLKFAEAMQPILARLELMTKQIAAVNEVIRYFGTWDAAVEFLREQAAHGNPLILSDDSLNPEFTMRDDEP